MKILVLYATYSGGTQKVAETITDFLQKAGNTVTLKNVADSKPSEMTQFDLILLGSCTWERTSDKKDGQLHLSFETFLTESYGMTFPNKHFAVFALGDKNYLHFCRAADYLSEFIHTIQGKEVITPLRVDSFFFNEEHNTSQIKTWVDKLIAS